MKELFPLRGIVTVLNTPFSATNTLDVPALKRHVEEALQAGVHGFLVPAMAAEVYKLTLEERLKMVEAVLATVNGKVPVIAGAGETDLHRSRKLLKSYMDMGCQHVLFQIPFRDETQFKSHFMKLAELQPEVIMLQDWDASGYGLPDALILELFEQVEAFRCLKVETVPAGVKYSSILELTQGRLNVSGGWAVAQMQDYKGVSMPLCPPACITFIHRFIRIMCREGKKKQKICLKLFCQYYPSPTSIWIFPFTFSKDCFTGRGFITPPTYVLRYCRSIVCMKK